MACSLASKVIFQTYPGFFFFLAFYAFLNLMYSAILIGIEKKIELSKFDEPL